MKLSILAQGEILLAFKAGFKSLRILAPPSQRRALQRPARSAACP